MSQHKLSTIESAPAQPKKSFQAYWPLVAVVLVALLGGVALGHAGSWHTVMTYFMGLFFLILATLKLFDVAAFAKAFAMYDVVAKRSRGYALSYPWIELGLGLGYLSGLFPTVVYSLTVFFMAIGLLGIIQQLGKPNSIRCACMGTAINVPLTTVTLVENSAMGLMALAMLVL